jgi:hypothetical protein
VQRFSSAISLGRNGAPESPLFVASDAEHPDAYVLVQELPMPGLAPDQARATHRRVVAQLETLGRHPGLPVALDAFAEHGWQFVVFGLPEGERLIDILRREGSIPEPAAIRLCLLALDALAGLERTMPPMAHGDLSPATIVVGEDGRVTLVGLSPTLLVEGPRTVVNGAAGGVEGYAAPEQREGRADIRSDLYALAVVLQHAITGSPPPRDGAGVEPGRRSPTLRTISPGLSGVLAQARRPVPAQRYQSVAAMREALFALLAGPEPPRAPPPRPSGPTAERPPAPAGLPGTVGALRAGLEIPEIKRRGGLSGLADRLRHK